MPLKLLTSIMLLVNIFFSPSFSQAQDLPLGDGLTEGPGLFSGEEGAFTLFEAKVSTKDSPKSTDTVALPIDDFVMFKEFLKAKSENTQEYKTFLIWLEYQSYLEKQLVK